MGVRRERWVISQFYFKINLQPQYQGWYEKKFSGIFKKEDKKKKPQTVLLFQIYLFRGLGQAEK